MSTKELTTSSGSVDKPVFPDLTPYNAAVVATAYLRKHGVLGPTEKIQGPRMYRLWEKNRIAGYRSDELGPSGKGKEMFRGDALAEWIRTYQRGSRSTSVDAEKLAELI